jgi:hypothetical protein
MREKQVDPIHAESDFVLHQAQIGVFQARAVSQDKATFTLMNVSKGFDPPNALSATPAHQRSHLVARAVVPPPVWSSNHPPKPMRHILFNLRYGWLSTIFMHTGILF